MADEVILTPGYNDIYNDPEQPSTKYLEKDNYLSEYDDENSKAIVRENIGVPSKDYSYSKQETNTEISKQIQKAIQNYLNQDDPHGLIPIVEEMIEGMAKTNVDNHFSVPQTGVDPLNDSHLTTKRFVTRLLKEHLQSEDPHQILQEVQNILTKYVKLSDIYSKSQLYTKYELDKQATNYIKSDGTTPFKKPQIGVNPTIDSHLSTKKYVDDVMQSHLVDVDPHNFITILNNRLTSYIKKKDVYDKTQTYSRTQIDSTIQSIINNILNSELDNKLESINDKFEYIRKQNYIKQDGSIPFRNPQAGVDAVEDNELVTLSQLKNLLESVSNNLSNNIKDSTWITSGPVETTVGFVEDNMEVPAEMTVQEIMDAIFYGKSISLHVPEFVTITKKCPITVCIHGSLALIEIAELYQDEELIYSFTKEDFENGCITVDSLPILKDTKFTFKVQYTNGSVHEESKLVKCFMPIFIGLLPKWKFANYITMDYLIELSKQDINKTQNVFIEYGDIKDLNSITFKYQFVDPELRHPFIVVPETYPDLEEMVTKSQSFSIEAFDIIDRIPLHIPEVEEAIIFKIFIYKQALSSLNQDVTFNFKNQTEE